MLDGRLGACSAKTPLASLITGLVVMVVMVAFLPVFTDMSLNAQVGRAGGRGQRAAGRSCTESMAVVVVVVVVAAGVEHG